MFCPQAGVWHRILAMEQTVVFVRLIVKGRVQGVFYRQTTRDKARQLNLKGWVANCDDGSVAIEAFGSALALEQLIKWCWQGSPSSKVDSVDVQWLGDEVSQPVVSGFEIRSDIGI